MLRINDISLPLDYDDNTIKKVVAQKLRVNVSDIQYASLYKRSVDARKKNNVHFQATVDVKLSLKEKNIADKIRSAVWVEEYKYNLPKSKPLTQRPVIIGSGPCGLFAALILAEAGQNPIVIERGYDVDRRAQDVNRFWTNGVLDTKSNVQFGEGGAGTFSDGKLTTGTKDERTRKVLLEFVENGAPNEILYLAKPHIGTDKLRDTVKNIRNKIISLGGEVLFETKLTRLRIKDGKIIGIETEKNGTKQIIPTDNIILAIGHSARDTFKMLEDNGIKMEQKAFSIGARIEHLQENINKQQYGEFWNSPYLSAADYKLAVHLKSGRGVYTFCMCPGGSVIAVASEKGRLVTNGMSEFARDGVNANSAILVGITPNDFGSNNVLAGIELQRRLESNAFKCGGENYYAPVQRVCDFIKRQKSKSLGSVIPSYKPGYELTNLDLCLPQYITDSIREGIQLMNNRLNGFSDGDAVLTATESRSSSPVRILRNENMQSVSVSGLYPCGEGAGFAGGIISAAVDGIKAAEMILLSSQK